MLFVRSFKNLKRLFASTDKLFASPLLGVLPAMIVLLSSVYAQNRSPLHLEKEISLPGAGGVSIISLQMFAAGACLLLLWRARLSEVLDIRKGKRSTEIKGLGEPQGVFYSSRNGGVTTIPLNSHPESFQLEEGDPRIFVNVPKEFAVTARPAAHEKRDWAGSRSVDRALWVESDDQLHRELEYPFVGRQLRYA